MFDRVICVFDKLYTAKLFLITYSALLSKLVSCEIPLCISLLGRKACRAGRESDKETARH